MRILIHIILLLATMLLLTGYIINAHWDRPLVQEVGRTTVTTTAEGSDWQWILTTHRSEVAKLPAFAETYNKIAYQADRAQNDLCQELQQAAIVAIEQTSKNFRGLYEAECITDAAANTPGIKMIIYPQVRYDYRFIITFIPTP